MARYAYNPFTRKLDRESGIDVVAVLPASGGDGDQVLNRADNTLYVYYAGSWQPMSGAPLSGPSYAIYGTAKYDTPASGTYA